MKVKKTWSSRAYKRAAHKHYQTCEQFLSHYENIRHDAKPHIVSNIYYLSGYVLECIFKSYLLDLDHCVNELTMEELSVKGLKTHNVKELWDRIENGINKKEYSWTHISCNWDVYVRYDKSDINYIELKQHFENTIRPIYLKIKDQF